MRSEAEMLGLILDTARVDERIRAVILNGSRANPNALADQFRDYDIVYVVTDVRSFTTDPGWIDRFGERAILQKPDDMLGGQHLPYRYAYLMQFRDGTRIDLTLFQADHLEQMGSDSLSVLLLDKDGRLPPFPAPDESDYWTKAPGAREFAECCNEFWWVLPYPAKGLARGQVIYALGIMEQVLRPELFKMLNWLIGLRGGFQQNPGKLGANYPALLPSDVYTLLLRTYTAAQADTAWQALDAMADLFEGAAREVGRAFQYGYPEGDAHQVREILKWFKEHSGERQS